MLQSSNIDSTPQLTVSTWFLLVLQCSGAPFFNVHFVVTNNRLPWGCNIWRPRRDGCCRPLCLWGMIGSTCPETWTKLACYRRRRDCLWNCFSLHNQGCYWLGEVKGHKELTRGTSTRDWASRTDLDSPWQSHHKSYAASWCSKLVCCHRHLW